MKKAKTTSLYSREELTRYLLEAYFQIPIKGAVVISRIIATEDIIQPVIYSQYMCKFLKSLPEAEHMPIIVAMDYIHNNSFVQDFG